MRKLFQLFSRNKPKRSAQRSKTQARSSSTGVPDDSTTTFQSVPVVRKVVRTGEFQIEVGDSEKHLVEGRIVAEHDMVLTIEGVPATSVLKFSKRRTTEVYEGDIGVTQRLSIRIERECGILPASKSKIRVSVNGRLAQIISIRPKPTARYVVFQHVMPCLFVLIAFYYAFIYRPEVGHFYSGLFGKPPTHQRTPNRQRGLPTHAGKSQQIAAVVSAEQRC